MRLCFVTPRYGSEIVGGAEKLLRDYAIQLHQRGHQVRIFTSCARNLFTWKNEHAPGTSTIDGLEVHRFPISEPRDERLMAQLQHAIDAGLPISPAAQELWLRNTGYSRPLLDAIAAAQGDVDLFVFAPYLLASTVYGAGVVPEKSVVVPCLHDEPYARFPAVQSMLAAVRGLLFNSTAELNLARGILPQLPEHAVVGGGMELPQTLEPRLFPGAPDPDVEYLVYAGRRDGAKNFPLLVDWLQAYNRENKRLLLVAMGSGDFPAEADPAIVNDAGFATAAQKLNAMAGALATVNLSRNESFSYVLMESWSCKRPVIVHAQCPVTVEHCRAAQGGVWVANTAEFTEALDLLRRSPQLARAMGENGYEYLCGEYLWPQVGERLESALTSLCV